MAISWKSTFLILLCSATVLNLPNHAYSVIPSKGETVQAAHERIFELFIKELTALRLDTTAIKDFRSWVKNLPADRKAELQKLRWPSFYATIYKAQEVWPQGPRSERMSLENMKIIYADLLHYAYYLNYQSSNDEEFQSFTNHVANILERAREAVVLDSLRDQEGRAVFVNQESYERILKEYVVEEIIQYLVFAMETVVAQGWEILERNWHPESFWHENIKGLGGRIVYQVSDRDLLSDLRDSDAHPAPILLIRDSEVGTPDFRIHLSKEEKIFFLRYFLSLKLPVNTAGYVSTLNRKFNFREKLRARRLQYLEDKNSENQAFDQKKTEFLDTRDFQ